jgi:hypothetical protein
MRVEQQVQDKRPSNAPWMSLGSGSSKSAPTSISPANRPSGRGAVRLAKGTSRAERASRFGDDDLFAPGRALDKLRQAGFSIGEVDGVHGMVPGQRWSRYAPFHRLKQDPKAIPIPRSPTSPNSVADPHRCPSAQRPDTPASAPGSHTGSAPRTDRPPAGSLFPPRCPSASQHPPRR